MKYFAVQYTYSSDADALAAIRPKHREFLASLAGGPLIASGPYVDVEVASALLLFRGETAAEIAALLDEDPFCHASLIVGRSITQWNPVIGVFAG
ncbi:YciI family protein [Tessaracoccus lacteus]|uniref:YciI family protein n=1 Tax=Tessaracoccus lacteus TaxID=3041766 RepID=A0ABY8PZJ9_9ACTN|nr:YciI family protein [Tessaracoccus sp. T21]WGT47924.1 YciI family protein [Tessaracoccus sp. T21]